jgi:S1-C subfamily serine protease
MNRSTPSQFALLHLDTTSTKLRSIPLSTKATIRQGDDVYVVSSPFGILTRETFQNSVTKGIVSNNITTRDGAPLAILTDARMLPGSEGGAVFRASTGELLAVCTLPLRRHDSIVEMNIAIAFAAVVPPLFHYIESHHLTLLAPSPALAIDSVSTYAPMVVDQAKQKVVYLHVGNAWSTGIIVSDSGHILTNAHLVKPFLKPNSMELVDHTQIVAMVTSDIGDLNKNRKLYAASIISVSLQGSYDIALLHIDKKTKDYFNLAHRTELRRGMDVFVVGYPLFQPLSTSGAIRRPTCTKGTLASIVHTRDKTPCLVQTSALVHMGNSGGAIINDHGELVGLVTSNIKHLNDRSSDSQKTEKLIPSMNFSIPPHALHPIVDYLLGRIDAHALQEWVDTNDDHVEKIWKLTGTLETKKIRKSKFMTIMEKQKKGEPDRGFIASRL